MGALPDNRQEQFAQNIAAGMKIGAAYENAGYSPHPGNARRLLERPSLESRVRELTDPDITYVSTTWVMQNLVDNVKRAMQAEEVLDKKGQPTGTYTYQGNVANRALELIGKSLGMFVEKNETKVVESPGLTPESADWLRSQILGLQTATKSKPSTDSSEDAETFLPQ